MCGRSVHVYIYVSARGGKEGIKYLIAGATGVLVWFLSRNLFLFNNVKHQIAFFFFYKGNKLTERLSTRSCTREIHAVREFRLRSLARFPKSETTVRVNITLDGSSF